MLQKIKVFVENTFVPKYTAIKSFIINNYQFYKHPRRILNIWKKKNTKQNCASNNI